MPPRIVGYAKSEPRFYAKSEDSVEVWLDDQAWILRRRKLPGTDDGTPNYTQDQLGPYAAALAKPVTRENEQGDREELEITHSLAIASDEVPQEKDRIKVRSEGPLQRELVAEYRVEGTVNPRQAAWGKTPVFQLDLVRIEEY